MPGVCFLLLLTCVLAGLFPGTSHFHALGLQPLAALLFFGHSLVAALGPPPAEMAAPDASAGLAAPSRAA